MKMLHLTQEFTLTLDTVELYLGNIFLTQTTSERLLEKQMLSWGPKNSGSAMMISQLHPLQDSSVGYRILCSAIRDTLSTQNPAAVCDRPGS